MAMVRDPGCECRLETAPFAQVGTDIPSSPIAGIVSITATSFNV